MGRVIFSILSIAIAVSAAVLLTPRPQATPEPISMQIVITPIPTVTPTPAPKPTRAPIVKKELVVPPPVILPAVATTVIPTIPPEPVIAPPPLPPIDEDMVQAAVVKVRCGHAYGSGYIRELNGKKYAITAAHVLIDQIDQGITTCDIIFPKKKPGYDFFEEGHYRVGIIQATSTTHANYTERGLDIAALEVLPLENQAEDKAIFPNGYPVLAYPTCTHTKPGNPLLLFGYSSNAGTVATPGGILSRYTGTIVQYGDVNGTKQLPNKTSASGFDYLPILAYTMNTSLAHSHTVIATNNNYFGASGGLVFDTAQNCVIGNNIAIAQSATRILGIAVNLNFNSSFINSLGK